MSFGHPEALLLILPVALLLWRRGLPAGLRARLRAACVLLVVLALSGPLLSRGGGGRDVMVLVDRSESMPPGADARALEAVATLEAARRPRDRLGIISFGRVARVERALGEGTTAGFDRPIGPDGTDLGAALDLSRDAIPPERDARVLVLSDGLDTNAGAAAAARRLAARGIAVDFRHLARAPGADRAVESLDAPAEVHRGETFLLSATLVSTQGGPVGYVLRRGRTVLAQGRAELPPGRTRLLFRDRLDAPGLADYTLELADAGDAVPENDRGRSLVRSRSEPRVLVVRSDGRRSALADALSGAFRVEVTSSPPRSLEGLDGVAVLVLENVPASALGEQGLRAVARWVRDAGGGLLMTGGRRSFGEGGYHRSALDDVLPVSLELRREQRRSRIALGISMDRSGSMAVITPQGVPKMQLAAEGAAAALHLLAPGDEAAVWAVDTRAHPVFPLMRVEDGLWLDLVASVRSEGGGIYIGEALEAAEAELKKARAPVRHLILFADAADSEEPGQYRQIIGRMRAAGITTSVIGMGTPQDADAALLTEIARLGGGRLYFAQNAAELPRLFSEETIVLARAAFVDEPAPLAAAPDAALLGPQPLDALPVIGGYNRTWLREGASALVRTSDDEAAPVLALRAAGLGHAAAFTGEADGEFSGALVRWPGYRALFTSVVRRLQREPDGAGAWHAGVRREGMELRVTLEQDETLPSLSGDDALSVSLLPADGSAPAEPVLLHRQDDGRLGARLPLPGPGAWFPVLRVGGGVLRAPPVVLAQSAEHAPRDPAAGRALLEQLAQLGGGRERLSLAGIFADGPRAGGERPLAPLLVGVALLLLLAETAARRFGVSSLAVKRLAQRLARAPREAKPAAAPQAAPGGGVPAPAGRSTAASRGDAAGLPDAPVSPPEAPGAAATSSGGKSGPDALQSALDKALERARRRLE